jgi:tRNA(fMet)-specific endonuclease VapC
LHATTAVLYGEVKSELKQMGTPIPENDIWIAAIARQYGLTVVSRDKHFSLIINLASESW